MNTSKKWRKPLFRQPDAGALPPLFVTLLSPPFPFGENHWLVCQRGRSGGLETPGGAGGGGGVWLSKKWLAPLFRGFHSSLAPTARPGSYARKPLLRKAFCGFAVHPPGGLLLSLRDNSPCVAKSDYSLRGLRPPSPQGFFDRLERGPGPKAPVPARSGRFASSRRPPSGRVSSNAKKAREKPGPTIYGAWPMKRCQEGARQRPHPLGKARAHALGARAASSAPPRATIL